MSHSDRPFWLGEDARSWDHARFHLCLLQDGRITSDHLGVYCSLAAHAEVRSGKAFPSAETIAGYLSLSEKHVRECTKDLEKWAYIKIEPRPGKSSIVRLLRPPTLDEWIAATGGTPTAPAATPEAPEPEDKPLSKATDESAFVEEARRLCDLFADLMVANGCKRPRITNTWVADMDRILRLDGREAANVEKAIRWVHADEFWRANVLSPSKLREKYDQLKLAASRGTAYAPSQRISRGLPASSNVDLNV